MREQLPKVEQDDAGFPAVLELRSCRCLPLPIATKRGPTPNPRSQSRNRKPGNLELFDSKSLGKQWGPLGIQLRDLFHHSLPTNGKYGPQRDTSANDSHICFTGLGVSDVVENSSACNSDPNAFAY